MTFEEWFVNEGHSKWDDAFEVAEEAWDYQQKRIDNLEHKRAVSDAFIAGMTYPKVVVADDKVNVRLQTDDFGNVSFGTVHEGEWIGLTDDEVEEAFSFPFHYRSFYKAVEAKLKEKNGG